MSIQRIFKLKYMITVCFALTILALSIKIAQPCETYLYEGSYDFDIEGNGSAEETVIYEGIRLKPGIYRIELEYKTDTNAQAVCKVKDGTVYEGGLLSNGEHLYAELGKTGYEIWLYETADNLQVVISHAEPIPLVTGTLKIVETKRLWTMYLTIVLFFMAVFYAVLIYRYYDKKHVISREQKQVFFFVMSIGFLASIAYLCGYVISGPDLSYHLRRIEGVKDGLQGGQFPVRLEPRWLYDHGYASAIFYCNALLYLPAILRMLGFTVSASYNVYCIMLNFATAWISYYCFSRMFHRQNIGIICSGLYTISIIRIYKILILGAVGEGTAITFIPLVMYGLYRILAENPEEKEYRTAWIPLMLGVSGLIQSHVLTCEVTVMVIALFCLACVRRIFCRATFFSFVKAVIFSLLINSWFLVPFVDYYMTQDIHIKNVAARTIQGYGLYPAHFFVHFWTSDVYTLSSSEGMHRPHLVAPGMILTATLGVFLILWFSGAFRERGRRIHFVKTTAIVCTLLLFMSLNIFPWDRIQFLNSVTAALISSLQFPNRLLGWTTAGMIFLFGFCLEYFESRDRKFYLGMMAVALTGIITSGMYLLDYVNNNGNYYELYNEEGMGFGYISGAEYLIEGTDSEKLTFAAPAAGSGVEISDYEKRSLGAEWICTNIMDTDSYVDLPLLLYKGYHAAIVSTGQELPLCAGENNVVRVVIPAGFNGRINVRFVSPGYWRISEGISLAAIVGFVILWYGYRRKKLEKKVEF